uniref:L-Fucosyltransferase n=1 Tax=Meloidogyne javanica TaxID=6303 RepID=A0A915LD24_MELJA
MQIPHHWNGQCGGLANQMWRFAVLYNMAKSVGRFPGIYNTSTWTCDKLNSPNEIENTFPILYSSLRYMQADPSDSAYDNVFETNCCRYINVTSIFGNYKQKYLIVPPTPQSPKFLENIDAEIRQLFRFSKQINTRVAAYIDKLFENDQSSHKFCVHTRRGDFGPPKWPMHARTERNFTEAAIKFILGYLKQVNKVYIPKAMNRGEDMCFGVWACDSILLTASSSTYAWWIAYLLEQADANVFYNSDFNHSYYDKENFPSDWIPLRLDSNLGRIIMD